MSDPTNQDFACATDCGTGIDESVRPRSLDDFIGQDELRANLRVYLGAARERGKALDHTLLRQSRSWQNHAGADHGVRAGRQPCVYVGACA